MKDATHANETRADLDRHTPLGAEIDRLRAEAAGLREALRTAEAALSRLSSALAGPDGYLFSVAFNAAETARAALADTEGGRE